MPRPSSISVCSERETTSRRREVLRGRRVAHHEALALGVAQDPALAAAALGDQDPARVHRRRVELHELDVLQRQPGAQRHRHPVAGAGVGVRGRAVEAADAAGGEQDGLAAERLQAAVEEVPGDHALAAALVLDELPREVLLVDRDVSLDELLVEHLDQDVAGDVGREDGARRAGGAERALRELAVVGAREDRAPVLELVDVARRLAREDLDRVLVAEVVGALDGVECVALGAVVAGVSERRVDPALGRAGVAAGRVELRDDRDVGTRVVSLDRGAHTSAAGADHEYVVLRVHRRLDRPARRRPLGRASAPRRRSGRSRTPLRALRKALGRDARGHASARLPARARRPRASTATASSELLRRSARARTPAARASAAAAKRSRSGAARRSPTSTRSSSRGSRRRGSTSCAWPRRRSGSTPSSRSAGTPRSSASSRPWSPRTRSRCAIGCRGQLMLTLYRCGRHGEALEVYRAAGWRSRTSSGSTPHPSCRSSSDGSCSQDPAAGPTGTRSPRRPSPERAELRLVTVLAVDRRPPTTIRSAIAACSTRRSPRCRTRSAAQPRHARAIRARGCWSRSSAPRRPATTTPHRAVLRPRELGLPAGIATGEVVDGAGRSSTRAVELARVGGIRLDERTDGARSRRAATRHAARRPHRGARRTCTERSR